MEIKIGATFRLRQFYYTNAICIPFSHPNIIIKKRAFLNCEAEKIVCRVELFPNLF